VCYVPNGATICIDYRMFLPCLAITFKIWVFGHLCLWPFLMFVTLFVAMQYYDKTAVAMLVIPFNTVHSPFEALYVTTCKEWLLSKASEISGLMLLQGKLNAVQAIRFQETPSTAGSVVCACWWFIIVFVTKVPVMCVFFRMVIVKC